MKPNWLTLFIATVQICHSVIAIKTLEICWVSMEKVLYNVDILDHILQYVKFRQILKLRLACSQLNKIVVHCPNFLGRGKGRFTAFRDYGIFNFLRIPLFRTAIVEEIEEGFQEFKKIAEFPMAKQVTDVRSCDHLRTLHVGYGILGSIDFQNIPVLNSSVFQQLQEIRFCHVAKIYETTNHEEENKRVTKNLVWFSTICKSLKLFYLESLALSNIIDSFLTDYYGAITQILKLNAQHLKSVKIGDRRVWKLPFWADIKMPLLKICTGNIASFGDSENENYLRDFLINHPRLTELSIAMTSLTNEMLEVFRNRGNYLKSLKIHSFIRRPTFMGAPTCWTFLKDFKRLETFSLTFFDLPVTNSDLGTRFSVDYLPEQTIKKICFRCPNVHNEKLLYQTLVAKPFMKLSSLEICGQENRIADSDLQNIFQRMTYLLKLKLSDCIDITDSGILGISTSSSEQTCISNLKALTVLKLTKCPKLTLAIKEGIAFPSLQKLSIPNFYKATNWNEDCVKKYVKTLISQNPSLEILTLQSNRPGFQNSKTNALGIRKLQEVVEKTSNRNCVLKIASYNARIDTSPFLSEESSNTRSFFRAIN